ncbi:iron ABC transporter ATP-binding protein [Antarcticirhabdus aurantiaca]|uniref:ABC transporter ATP-binding protein n=1 Tax=Antarcticirhabdus aurantiaca TaxID=2606717 RepID=A0ACD4NP46_9HYPH|nr:ABC transporter ATP-binding protein [Antarcticirhabdus aurantiaca]WAJ28471.1 ABC transporter ATP-binding protein [Jeongeuplla avenae]
MIEARSVSKSYGPALVVDGVSVTIPKGGVTAVIGPNGAGKSTLLSMVSRLVGMDAGTVTVDGLDVSRTPGDVLARRLSILRQEQAVTVRLTVADLVAFGRYPHSKGRPTIEDEARVEAALAWLGLDELSGRFLDELSGGQRQRAFVAMVLCQDTDYVLLDEPLNNLDLKHAVGMMRLLRRAADELDKTVVVVLHDINFASCYADTILAMKNGRLAHQGPPAEIMRPEVLRDLYEIEVDVEEIGGKRIGLYFDARG